MSNNLLDALKNRLRSAGISDNLLDDLSANQNMTAILIKLNEDILTGSNTFKIALKDISIFEEWIKLSDANFPASFRKNADILENAKVLDCN